MCLLLLQIPPNHADVSTQLPPALKKCLLQQHPTQLRRLGDSLHTNCAQKKATTVQAAQCVEEGHPSIGRGGIIVCYQQRPLAALAVTEEDSSLSDGSLSPQMPLHGLHSASTASKELETPARASNQQEKNCSYSAKKCPNDWWSLLK